MYTSCTLVHLSINVHLYMVDRKSVSPDKNLKAFLGVSAKRAGYQAFTIQCQYCSFWTLGMSECEAHIYWGWTLLPSVSTGYQVDDGGKASE